MSPAPCLEEIQSLEEALHRPEVRRSKSALEELLADGFVEIGASGMTYDRTQMIGHLLQQSDGNAGTLRANNFVLTHISDSAVLLTYETERVFEDSSKRHALRSSIWKHDGTRWQMLFHQGTLRT